MFRSRYYKKSNYKEYTEEEKKIYKEQKEKERLEDNSITFTIEEDYKDDFRKYLNIDDIVIVAEFQYREDKVSSIKKLNSNERKIAHYDSDLKCWVIELKKINIEEFKNIFKPFDIKVIINIEGLKIRENWELIEEILNMNTLIDSNKYKDAIKYLAKIPESKEKLKKMMEEEKKEIEYIKTLRILKRIKTIKKENKNINNENLIKNTWKLIYNDYRDFIITKKLHYTIDDVKKIVNNLDNDIYKKYINDEINREQLEEELNK